MSALYHRLKVEPKLRIKPGKSTRLFKTAVWGNSHVGGEMAFSVQRKRED